MDEKGAEDRWDRGKWRKERRLKSKDAFLYPFPASFCRETVKRCPLNAFFPSTKKVLKDFDDL